MYTRIRRLLLVTIVGCILTEAVRPISAQSPAVDTQQVGLYELDRISKARQDSATTKADLFVEWMSSHDWKSMELHDLYNLYSFINVDAVDRTQFSARWARSLTAPVTGAYTIRQVRVYRGTNSRLKVSIGGKIVLDSTGEPSSETAYASGPIELAAGEPVPIQVDMVHNGGHINFSESAPMVLLTWQHAGSKEAIIPTTAFTPPTGFANEHEHGLKGEYFGKTTFEDLRVTRLDPALDLIWSWPPTASVHSEDAQQVFDACTTKVLDGDFLSRSVSEGKLSVLDYNMWRIAYRMTATQRQQLVEILRQRPDVLAVLSPEAMGRLMQACYMLPSNDQVDLLGEWSLLRPQPRCEAGRLAGWGDGYYRKLNTDFYWLLGQFMQGPYRDDAEALCDLYLELPNHDCNLTVAYAAAFAARANGNPSAILDKLTAKIDDPAIKGDRIVTWLIARAFAQGVMGPTIEPLSGYSDLDSAYVSAESDEYKFWALQEMVGRLSSTDHSERAKQLIEENRGKLTSPEQQAAMNQWAAKADELAAVYVQDRANQKKAAQTAYVNELKRRQQLATERGDADAVSRYTGMIGALEAAQP